MPCLTPDERRSQARQALAAAGLTGAAADLDRIAYTLAGGPCGPDAIEALARCAVARPRPAPATPRPAPVAPAAPSPAAPSPAAPSPAELARQAQLAEQRRRDAILALTPAGRAVLAGRK